ncbi:MAG: penicillin-binding transpeptidase domain-containing protein, partial [Clostridia bacterium]|nr:penicillin-binding transpeptidase domain-containing protein [Clostridia bacterium]
IQEMIRAIQLERKLSKDEILELYLNSFYLGQGCNGIKSASLYYFKKDVGELTIAEGASLVGITQYPSLYDPLVNPDKNKEKQEIVLAKMLEHEYITQEEYDEAIAEELKFVGSGSADGISKQSYFVDEIIREVLRDLQDELGYTEAVATKMLYSGGLKIYSTVDPEIQAIVDKVFSDPDNLKAGSKGTPQASMTIMDPYTGEVKALVGGFGEKTGSLTLNRATQTLRQPGSTIKPIAVYGPALENGLIEPSSVYEDKSITIGDWSPKNYYSGFKGKVSVKYAIDQSINTVPVQILQKLGIDKSYDFLSQKLGVTSLVPSDRNLASLALGGLTKGISNMELTAAYSAFANDGVYNTPICYTKVEDSEGNVILEKKTKSNVAMKSSTARTVNGLLKSVCDSGTGTPARFSSSYSIAGKTGTTDDDMDRWFVGYTPYYCAAVWVGYDTQSSLSFYSSNPTIPLWKKVMQEVHSVKKLPSGSFKYTPIYVDEEAIRELNGIEILENKLCSESGLKATDKCPEDKLIDEDTSKIEGHCKLHLKTDEVEDETGEESSENKIDDSLLSDTGL